MTSLQKRKQSRWKPGMVYAVPLTDGSFGIAQAGEPQGDFASVIYVALFEDRYIDMPIEIPNLRKDKVVSLSATWRKDLNRGTWLSIGVEDELFKKSEFPNERYASNGYIGAINSDANLLSSFLSAVHGLIPWNVKFDPNYYDKMLPPGVSRPESAIILSDEEREKYRREVLKVNA